MTPKGRLAHVKAMRRDANQMAGDMEAVSEAADSDDEQVVAGDAAADLRRATDALDDVIRSLEILAGVR